MSSQFRWSQNLCWCDWSHNKHQSARNCCWFKQIADPWWKGTCIKARYKLSMTNVMDCPTKVIVFFPRLRLENKNWIQDPDTQWTRIYQNQVSQQVLNMDLGKKISKSQKAKNSWKFVYILLSRADLPSIWRIFWQKKT